MTKSIYVQYHSQPKALDRWYWPCTWWNLRVPVRGVSVGDSFGQQERPQVHRVRSNGRCCCRRALQLVASIEIGWHSYRPPFHWNKMGVSSHVLHTQNRQIATRNSCIMPYAVVRATWSEGASAGIMASSWWMISRNDGRSAGECAQQLRINVAYWIGQSYWVADCG